VSKQTNDIPVGYQLHIHSWENDADAYGLEVLSGLSKDDVKFYLELLEHFRSRSRGKGGFGNTINEVDYQKVAKTIQNTLEANPGVSKDIKETFDLSDVFEEEHDSEDDLNDALSDACQEVMGDLIGGSETYDFRVFDRAEVYYYPAPVKNVTREFTSKS
jgi:hypothetical protein